jgi:hypothetical protein
MPRDKRELGDAPVVMLHVHVLRHRRGRCKRQWHSSQRGLMETDSLAMVLGMLVEVCKEDVQDGCVQLTASPALHLHCGKAHCE